MSKWISVKDRKPETYDHVLVVYRNKRGDRETHFVTYGFREGRSRWCWYDGSLFRNFTVTHWMPLPKPPEGAK